MTLVNCIDKIVEWLQDNVCSQVFLKLPDDDRNDANNAVEYVNPSAFPLYVPGKDRLPPNVPAPIPSVCVQLMEGKDELLEKRRSLNIRLCIACWNPGTHGDEILHPLGGTENNTAILGKMILGKGVLGKAAVPGLDGYSYYQESNGAAQTYARNMNGWRDSFNFVDLILRELEGTEYINGLRLVKESDIKYGLFTEDGNIWDYYPYWHSWITFTLEAGVVVKPRPYEDLL